MVYIHKKIYNYYMLLLMRVKQTDIISINTKLVKHMCASKRLSKCLQVQ